MTNTKSAASLEYDGKSYKVSIVTLTPEDANNLIKSSDGNRKLNTANIARIKRAIVNGTYRLNGETIIIDKDGKLIDGFHRCTALVEAGEGYTLTTFVVYGIEAESKKSVDIGANRNATNAFQMEGIKYAADASRLAFRLLQEKAGERYRTGATCTFDGDIKNILNEYNSHSELCQEAISFYNTVGKRIPNMPKTTMEFMYVWLTELGHPKEKIQLFFRQAALLEPVMCKTVRTLLSRLQKKDDEKKVRQIQASEAIIFRAWNAFVEGRELESITFVLPRDKDLPLK